MLHPSIGLSFATSMSGGPKAVQSTWSKVQYSSESQEGEILLCYVSLLFVALNLGSVISEYSVNKTGKLLLLRANTIAFLCLRRWCVANGWAVIHIFPVFTNTETHALSPNETLLSRGLLSCTALFSFLTSPSILVGLLHHCMYKLKPFQCLVEKCSSWQTNITYFICGNKKVYE